MLGRDKRTATLDLSRPEGEQVFLPLVRDADIVVENIRSGPPTVPPLALTDNFAGLAATITVLTASRPGTHRARPGRRPGRIEPILTMPGPESLAYDQLGYITQTRRQPVRG